MIVELVLFINPPGLDRAAELEGAARSWTNGGPTPISCASTSCDRRTASWRRRLRLEVARRRRCRARSRMQAAAKARTGSEPTRQFFELLLVVDNETGKVTEHTG